MNTYYIYLNGQSQGVINAETDIDARKDWAKGHPWLNPYDLHATREPILPPAAPPAPTWLQTTSDALCDLLGVGVGVVALAGAAWALWLFGLPSVPVLLTLILLALIFR